MCDYCGEATAHHPFFENITMPCDIGRRLKNERLGLVVPCMLIGGNRLEIMEDPHSTIYLCDEHFQLVCSELDRM